MIGAAFLIAQLTTAAVFLIAPASAYAQAPQERMSWAKFREDPDRVKAFKDAVRTMSNLQDDPRSWRFQANMHDERDAEENADWRKCEHGTWHFFTWHRMYIHYFEDILRKYANSDSLRLPYWPWEQPGQRGLPEEFRREFEPDGVTRNPLYVKERQMNDATMEVRWQQRDFETQMASRSFVGLVAGQGIVPGFGGGARRPNGQILPNQPGTFEGFPHGNIHVDVGGNGWMRWPWLAARDPIFWLHHCNIDRLWERWRTQPGRVEPAGEWRTQNYSFYDRDKQRVTRRVEEFLTLATLGYKYDDVAAPAAQVLPTDAIKIAPLHLALPHDGPTPTGSAAPVSDLKMLTLTKPKAAQGLTVEKTPATINIEQDKGLENKWRSLLSESESPEAPRRVFVRLEDVKFATPPTYNLEVYLNKREASAKTQPDDPQYVGTINFFAAGHHDKHAGHGSEPPRSYRFDVTSCLANSKKASTYDPDNIAVTVVPVGPQRKDGAAEEPAKPVAITVGNIVLETVVETQ